MSASFSSKEFAAAWRDEVGTLVGVESVGFSSTRHGLHRPIDFVVAHADIPTLEEISREVTRHLGEFAGVKDVDDGIAMGKPQWNLTLTEEGANAGLTVAEIGEQLRACLLRRGGATAAAWAQRDQGHGAAAAGGARFSRLGQHPAAADAGRRRDPADASREGVAWPRLSLHRPHRRSAHAADPGGCGRERRQRQGDRAVPVQRLSCPSSSSATPGWTLASAGGQRISRPFEITWCWG